MSPLVLFFFFREDDAPRDNTVVESVFLFFFFLHNRARESQVDARSFARFIPSLMYVYIYSRLSASGILSFLLFACWLQISADAAGDATVRGGRELLIKKLYFRQHSLCSCVCDIF